MGPVPAPSPVTGRAGAPAGLPGLTAVMARARAENFPVASRLLPRRVRSHLLAIYGFARLVDDVGDEAPGDRLALLDWLEDELEAVYRGTPAHPLMRRLALTVRACRLPEEPFLRLIEANRRDQAIHRYGSFEQLLGYCELSANPVGHLVLHVLGAATPRRLRLADAVCTGLQLAEHWQDVGQDARRGRVYLPADDLARFGVAEEDLRAPTAGPALRRLMAFEVGRAREALDRGAPLARDLGGRARLAVAGFVAGGRAALDAIARTRYDVLGRIPRASRSLRARWLVRTLAGPVEGSR